MHQPAMSIRKVIEQASSIVYGNNYNALIANNMKLLGETHQNHQDGTCKTLFGEKIERWNMWPTRTGKHRYEKTGRPEQSLAPILGETLLKCFRRINADLSSHGNPMKGSRYEQQVSCVAWLGKRKPTPESEAAEAAAKQHEQKRHAWMVEVQRRLDVWRIKYFYRPHPTVIIQRACRRAWRRQEERKARAWRRQEESKARRYESWENYLDYDGDETLTTEVVSAEETPAQPAKGVPPIEQPAANHSNPAQQQQEQQSKQEQGKQQEQEQQQQEQEQEQQQQEQQSKQEQQSRQELKSKQQQEQQQKQRQQKKKKKKKKRTNKKYERPEQR